MIVSCENCKKRYRIDAQKLKTEKSKFKCTRCGQTIYIKKPPETEISSVNNSEKDHERVSYNEKDYEKRLREVVLKRLSSEEASGTANPSVQSEAANNLRSGSLKKRFTGLWGNMMLFLIFIPLFILLFSVLLALWRFETLKGFIERESDTEASLLAEDNIAKICRAVAIQTGLYLKTHSELNSDQFMKNPVFKRIAVQQVGTNNHTMLYQMPDQKGALWVWAHKNPAFTGRDLRNISRESAQAIAGDNFSLFLKVLTGVRGLKESKGRFQVRDSNGKLRDKYLVCTPIEGTPYVIAADVFMDEFKLPVQQSGKRIIDKICETRNIIVISLLTAMLASGTVVFIYSRRLTRAIAELTHAANRISAGEFGVKLEIGRKDEIGDLSHAIGRLQESTRILLKRAGNRQKN